MGSKRKADAELVYHLESLNSQFAAWVRAQAASHAAELWVDGARDYIKHAEGLLEEFGGGPAPATPRPDEAPAARTISFEAAPLAAKPTFGAPKPNTVTTTNGGPKTEDAPLGGAGLFAFSTKPGRAGEADGKSAPGVSGGFSFGGVGGEGFAGDSAPFAFGAGDTGGKPSTTTTSFGVPPPGVPTFGGGGGGFKSAFATSSDAAAAGGAAEGGDEPEEKPKYKPELEVSEDEGTAILFKSKAKVYYKNDSGWDDRGLGQLSVRKKKAADGEDPTRPYIAFTTDTGRILMTAPIHKGMSATVPASNAKKNSFVTNACLSNTDGEADTDDSGKPVFTNILVRMNPLKVVEAVEMISKFSKE